MRFDPALLAFLGQPAAVPAGARLVKRMGLIPVKQIVPDKISRAQVFGRIGGLIGGSKGGKVRAQNLSAEERSRACSEASKKRWEAMRRGGC